MRDRSTGARKWSRLLIIVVMCSLTLSLATRYWSPGTIHVHPKKLLQHQSSEAKRQHLNRDAAQWDVPLVSFSILAPSFVGARMINMGPPVQNQILDSSLYTRPPPFSSFKL